LGCEAESERAYRILQDSGLEVFYDDRNERAGVKFMDADLMGFPLRLTVSERSLREGGVEFKLRTSAEKRILPWDGLAGEVKREFVRLSGEEKGISDAHGTP
jgi:prolyl-tRNA synthetase